MGGALLYKRSMILRLFNAGLRLGSLGVKMILTLYMGRYLGLDQFGTYGLVAASVAIAIPLMGLRTDYSITRELVTSSGVDLAAKMRDQAVFYGLNYIIVALGVVVLLWGVPGAVDYHVGIYALLLSILESLATMTSTNLVSLRRPVLANVLFFVRSAAWAIPVMVIGFFQPEWRTAQAVFIFWSAGVLASLAVTAWFWRDIPWLEAFRRPVDWKWVKSHVRMSFFIWLGAVGAAAAGNADRFVVDHFLGREFVGISSFYGSFVVAISSLLYSGIFAFGFPQLVNHYRERNDAAFRHEAWRLTLHASVSGGILALIIGVIVPQLGGFLGRQEFEDQAFTLWLILFGIWLRSVTESIYYVMYARHQDRPIWIGNLLQLLVALVSGVLLVASLGFEGVGYSAIATSVFIGLWRLYFLKRGIPPRPDTGGEI